MFLASLLPAVHRSSLLERALDEAFALSQPLRPQSQLSRLNLAATEDEVTLTMQLPGIALENIDCSVQHDQLVISARRDSPPVGSAASAPAEPASSATSATPPTPRAKAEVIWHRHERSEQAISRRITLPYAVEPEHTVARMVDGVLTITARRREADRPRRIAVSAA
jgi:HSP20 family protein